MFIPLVDVLRCINAHEDAWLVASIDSAVERDIRSGLLGCPVCSAEYPIRNGVVMFSEQVARAPFRSPSEEDAVRLAAALDLTDGKMTAVLHGDWGAHAQLIRGFSPAQLLLVNPPDGVESGDGISIVVADVAPFAHGSMSAVAIDATASDIMAASLLASLSGGGRALGAASRRVPQGLEELARDDDVWVAQLESAVTSSAPIGIRRRPPR